MDSFGECYKRARTIAKDYKFFSDYGGLFEVGSLGVLMAVDGPKRQHSARLDNLRLILGAERLFSNKSLGETIVKECDSAKPSGVVSFVKSFVSTHSLQDRCATMKMLSHLYLVRRRGAQDVWVYSPPVDYKKWIFDETSGLTKDKLALLLDKEDEVYSYKDKTIMAEATTMALAWSLKALIWLTIPGAGTKAAIRRWFLKAGADDDALDEVRKTLLKGFSKFAVVLNSGKLVLSDEPKDRNAGGWKDFAFVYKSEKLDVIYVQNATLKAGKKGHMWLAALTLVHELSHREMATDDHRYDSDGKLSPQATGGLSPAKAITNADNWGYFAADLNGMLMPGKQQSVSGIV